MPARTSILAAANPVGGHYNKAKTVCENLKINPALLSRFDLVFILVDKPNEEHDIRLSDHIMSLHGGCSSNRGGRDSLASSQDFKNRSVSSISERSLLNQLVLGPGMLFDEIMILLVFEGFSFISRRRGF